MHKYQCSKCKYAFDYFEGYDDDPQTRDCPSCENAKGQILYLGYFGALFGVQNDYKPFTSPVTGQVLDGKKDLKEHLKKTGCRIVDPSEAKQHGIQT